MCFILSISELAAPKLATGYLFDFGGFRAWDVGRGAFSSEKWRFRNEK